MWRLGFLVLMILGCGGISLAPEDLRVSVDVASTDAGAEELSSTVQSPDAGAKADAETHPSINADSLSPDTGPSCDERCAAWCANGKEGSLVGCGCGC